MSLRGRIHKALLASLFGWLAGLVVATPFQVVEATRNTVGHLLARDLVAALTLWFVLTVAMALYWCGAFLLPMIWLLSAARILRHRTLWIAGSLVFGVVLMAIRLHVWTALYHDGISLINFVMWAAFAGTFFSITAAMYTRYLAASSTGIPSPDAVSGSGITL